MLACHAKFTPDGNFGNIKICISKSDCNSILDLTDPEGRQKSSDNNTEIVYKDPRTLALNFNWYDWQVFYKQSLGLGLAMEYKSGT